MDFIKTRKFPPRAFRAFTLVEMMIVITIIGIIAAIGIPSYARSVDKGLARQMVDSLRAIANGQEGYRAANDVYYGVGGATQAELNLELGLNLMSQKGVTYSCDISNLAPGSTGTCDATYPGRFTYRITTSMAILPPWSQITCASGTCPTGVP
jgi:type IV pilus assembly protein PilE